MALIENRETPDVWSSFTFVVEVARVVTTGGNAEIGMIRLQWCAIEQRGERKRGAYVDSRGVRFSNIFKVVSNSNSPILVKKCPKIIQNVFFRPKIDQIFVITHYIYKLFPACQMFSDCH